MTDKQILIFMEKCAIQKGWHLTPDTELIGFLKEGFQENLRRYGYLSCPCREAAGRRDKDGDIVCPCNYSAPDIEEHGQCFCGLYLSEEVFQQGGAPGSIPERRPEALLWDD